MRYFEKQAVIKMEDGKYVVYSEAGKKFGEYEDIEGAHKRLKQMEIFKYMDKTAEEMTAEEKADQKYAIAKSYEEDGHPRKAKEYKAKASRAYKHAYEKNSQQYRYGTPRTDVERIMKHLNVSEEEARKILKRKSISKILPVRGTGRA